MKLLRRSFHETSMKEVKGVDDAAGPLRQREVLGKHLP
jgi:hypothetical protein